jgi:hypothetical protein
MWAYGRRYLAEMPGFGPAKTVESALKWAVFGRFWVVFGCFLAQNQGRFAAGFTVLSLSSPLRSWRQGLGTEGPGARIHS